MNSVKDAWESGKTQRSVAPAEVDDDDLLEEELVEVEDDSVPERPKTRAGARVRMLEPVNDEISTIDRSSGVSSELTEINGSDMQGHSPTAAKDLVPDPGADVGGKSKVAEETKEAPCIRIAVAPEKAESLPGDTDAPGSTISLMSLAKDPECKAEEFLKLARRNPDELLWTDEKYAEIDGVCVDAAPKKAGAVSLVSFAWRGLEEEDEEHGLTAVHHFLARCKDITGEVIVALDQLDDNFLARKTSMLRTPVHMYMASNSSITDDVMIEINNCIRDAFIRRDVHGQTPIDRYFTENNGIMDVEKDPIVLGLCSVDGSWGVDALVRSKDGYTNDLLDDVLFRYKVYSDGNPFEVETFTKNFMCSRHPEAQIKFMFAFLPLRSPNKYGLSGTQSLGIMTKVLTSMADCYSQSKDSRLKSIWLDSFADMATMMIEDDELLSGMVMDVPSNLSVEALASTEFMSVVLQFKFNSGPVLLFWIELTLFLAQFALIFTQILAPNPELWAVILSLLLSAFFTGRELVQMHEMRSDEIAAYAKWDSQVGAQDDDDDDDEDEALFGVGDIVRIAQEGPLCGAEATVVDPNWNGMVKVVHVDEGDGTKSVLTFLSHEVDLVAAAVTVVDSAPNKKVEKPIRNGWLSRFVTVYLGMAVAYRSDVFNWIDIATTFMCWVTQIILLLEALNVMQPNSIEHIESLHVLTVSLLSLKLLGFLRGTGKKMATFIIMFQEIIANVDSFVFVFVLVLVMFSFVYHILLKGVDVGDDFDDDTVDHRELPQSIWNVWIYSLGEFHNAAYPNDQARALFTALLFTVQIMLMNILIAIVSDSYAAAMSRSAPLFWRARVELVAEYEHLLPKVNEEDEFLSLMDAKTQKRYLSARTPPPKTWQYHCLMFQEGTVATGIVCGLVVFELMYVSKLDDSGTFSERFFFGLGISLFFLVEIALRFYTWWSTVHQWADSMDTIGGFFTNYFRLIDSVLVLIDMVMLILTVSTPSEGSASRAKAAVKLARVVRFARSARWLRGIKMMRSCRFFANLGHHWRQYSRPQKPDVIAGLKESFLELEESKAWAGRESTVEMKVRQDLARSVSEIIAGFKDVHAEAERNRDVTEAASNERMQMVIDNIVTENAKAAAHRELIEKHSASRLDQLEAKTHEHLRETERKMDQFLAAFAELKQIMEKK